MRTKEFIHEKYIENYKRSINYSNTNGLLQSIKKNEDIEDYKIYNFKKLDYVLGKLCDMVDKGQKINPKIYGMIAAAIIDNNNRIITGINLPAKNGKRRHAERVAIDKYKSKYGEIPDGSIIVTTCSPCSDLMNERYGESCTDLINDNGIKKVYVGFIDPSQTQENISFNQLETENKQIKNRCKQFVKSFVSTEHFLDEGWREVVAAAIPIAGLGFHGANLYKGEKVPQQPTAQVVQVPQKQQIKTFQPTEPARQVAQQKLEPKEIPKPKNKEYQKEYKPTSQSEHVLYTIAVNAGLHGIELAQFLAQMQHESWDFKKLREVPQGKDYFKKYDPKHAPKTARILGNKSPGDGAKYKGRSFIQLTGRDNYQQAGDALGIMFVNPNPKDKKAEQLAALNRKKLETDMVLAAKVALWYWSTRVKPYVKNFSDTAAVTKFINPALYGLKDRHENFIDYLHKLK